MHKKNVEIFHQGWLVKSPPNPRGIFRARWRRRWFTLKQGELPGQFFLEYYTDQSCRKRKGIIDLDQVEQVDAGLRLDRQSIKFQHMFDMKTPNRTYYLAADSEKDMRDWVMVICQVCNLQETEEKNGGESSTVQYYNVGPNADFEAKEIPQNDQSVATESTVLTNSSTEPSSLSGRFDQLSIVNEYENDNVVTYRQSEYSNRSTVMVGESQNNNQDAGLNYSNLPPMGTMEKPKPAARPSSLVAKSTGAIKKIPENLKLRSDDKINNNNAEEMSLYRASGPYIPLSDCFSGSPVLFKNESDPKTPLNSLDPKFYDTPRSHITSIGLNLTDDQPNSPKRNNTSNAVPMNMAPKYSKSVARSVNSSPTDSEGGSTDEEWTEHKVGNRKTRPSDSSMENESIAIIAVQSYMKMAGNPIPLPPKRMSLVMEKKQETSDTEENASPLMPIGPKDSSSCVDERYDFPRSYNVQGFTGSHMNIGTMGSMTSIQGNGHLMTSTPNLIHSSASTLDRSQMNFYSNAAPRDNNIFRFDFANTAPPPEVNRTLKPRKELNGYGLKSVVQAPTVNRKLKPGTFSKPQLAIGTNSLKRRGPDSLSLSEIDNSTFLDDSLTSNQAFGLSPKTPNACEDRLQYLDIEHTNSPPKGGLGSVASAPFANTTMTMDGSLNGSIKEGPGCAYTTVDFVKTDAFNRVREDSEMTRASKSRMKN